jgi:hypothetical protein
MSNKPVAKFQSVVAPGLDVAMWQSEKGGFTFTIQKRYKNAAGEWTDSKSLFAQDLAGLQQILGKAIEEADRRRASRQPSDAPSSAVQAFTAAPAPEGGIDDDDIPF